MQLPLYTTSWVHGGTSLQKETDNQGVASGDLILLCIFGVRVSVLSIQAGSEAPTPTPLDGPFSDDKFLLQSYPEPC